MYYYCSNRHPPSFSFYIIHLMSFSYGKISSSLVYWWMKQQMEPKTESLDCPLSYNVFGKMLKVVRKEDVRETSFCTVKYFRL